MLEYSGFLSKKHDKSGHSITTTYYLSRIYTGRISSEDRMRKYRTESQGVHGNIYHYYGFKERF